jgi:hypothetical protein
MAFRSNKPRSPHELIQTNLRLRVEEHAWLTAEARAHRCTLHSEIMARLMSTKEQRALLTAHQLAENASRLLDPYLLAAHERAVYGDLVRASERLIALMEPLIATGAIGGGVGEQIKAASEKLRGARRVLELEAGARLIRKGTTGFDVGDRPAPGRGRQYL